MYTKEQVLLIFRINKKQGECVFPQNLEHCNIKCPFWNSKCNDANELYLKSKEILSTISDADIFEAML